MIRAHRRRAPGLATIARDAGSRHQARRRAHAAERRLRRPDLRRLVRGARRGARAARHAAPASWCSTATRSASGRPPRAPRRPSGWSNLGLEGSIRQTFARLVVHTPGADVPLAAAVDVLDVRLPGAVRAAVGAGGDATFETAKVDGTRAGATSCTPTAATCARRWSSTRSAGAGCSATARAIQPPEARALARPGGPPAGRRRRPRAVDRPASTCAPATAGRSPPATRCASASARSTRASTSRSRRSGSPRTSASSRVRYQGNWIPHRLRPATERRRVLRRRLAPATACR